MRIWCDRVSAKTGTAWRYARINQATFDQAKAKTLEDLVNPS